MNTARPEPALSVLVLEPDFLLRRTVAGVVRELGLARMHEAASVDLARRLLGTERVDALLVALDEEGDALRLLIDIRADHLACAAQVPLAVTAVRCDASLAVRLKALDIRRLLLKPYRVKDMVLTLRQLLQAQPVTPA